MVLFAAQKADPLNLKGEPARGRDRSRGQDATCTQLNISLYQVEFHSNVASEIFKLAFFVLLPPSRISVAHQSVHVVV